LRSPNRSSIKQEKGPFGLFSFLFICKSISRGKEIHRNQRQAQQARLGKGKQSASGGNEGDSIAKDNIGADFTVICSIYKGGQCISLL